MSFELNILCDVINVAWTRATDDVAGSWKFLGLLNVII